MDDKQLPTSSCKNGQNKEVFKVGTQNLINGIRLESEQKITEQLELENKDRRSMQQSYFPQQRHSQQEDNFHQQDTSPQMQSNHVPSPRNTQQREEVTCTHSDLQGQPEQQLEPNNTHAQYMAQKVHGDVQTNSTMGANTNKLGILFSVLAKDIKICFPSEENRKANVMLYESGEEHRRVQQESNRADVIRRAIPRLSQEESNDEVDLISIGPNNTGIPKNDYEYLDFTNASLVARKLLTICFSREILATHSLTGNKSPAFPDKVIKEALDPLIVQDIIFAVTTRSGVSAKEVCAAITTKCADESKMWRKKHPELSKKTDKEI